MEMVQTVVMSKLGQLSLTLIPRQPDGTTTIIANGVHYFLNSASSDGDNGTARTMFYVLVESINDLSKKEESPVEAAVPEVATAEEPVEKVKRTRRSKAQMLEQN